MEFFYYILDEQGKHHFQSKIETENITTADKIFKAQTSDDPSKSSSNVIVTLQEIEK
jgi:hypothetical protein